MVAATPHIARDEATHFILCTSEGSRKQPRILSRRRSMLVADDVRSVCAEVRGTTRPTGRGIRHSKLGFWATHR